MAELPRVRVTEVGLREAVTPVGAPETERLTVPANPFRDVKVRVEVPELPWAIVRDVGEVLIEKSGGGETVSEMGVLCVKAPLVPVTVSV